MPSLKRAALATAVGVAGVAHVAPYALTLAAYEPIRLGAIRRLQPEFFGVGRNGHMALTFDDGPDSRGTPEILDALDINGWKATFFMVGEMVRRHSDVAQEVVRRGHEVGVHSYSHQSFMRLPFPLAIEDLNRTVDAIHEVTGSVPRYFRPPFGTLSGPALLAAKAVKLQTVLWTAWGKDWEGDTTPVQIAANITRGVLDGGTLLLHDSDCTSSANSWQRTLATLPLLAELVAHEGLRVGTLTDHWN